MIKNILFSAIILFSVQIKTMACSCFPAGYHFCETLQNDTTIASVVMVQKLSDYHYGMDVKVLLNISGEITEDTIRVWGDNGALCRLYTGWPVGDTLILALHHTDMTGNMIHNPDFPPNLEDSSDYHISGCGVYALNVNNGMVTGSINAQSLQQMPLNTFLAMGCLQLGAEENPLDHLQLYPNPANDVVLFSSVNVNLGELQVEIINCLGQSVYHQASFTLDQSLNISNLTEGVYTVVVSNGSKKQAFRLIKQ